MADDKLKFTSLPAGEAAAAGGVTDVTAPWVSTLGRINTDPVLSGRDLLLYEELLRDDAVAVAFNARRLALLGKPVEVVDGADDAQSKLAAEDLRRQLAAISWDTVTGAMLVGRILGYSVGECMFRRGGAGVELERIHVRKARRFTFGVGGELLLKTRARPMGEVLPDNKFWVFRSYEDVTDDPFGYGLGQILYWLVWFKRNDVKLWFQALDKYASPTAYGEFTPGAPKEEQDKLLAALVAIRNSSAITVPQGFAVKFLEAAKSGVGDYAAAHKMLDEAITLVIAGQTMTSRQGSSEAQANVHQDTLSAIIRADDDVLSESFNAGPAAWLTAWNFPGATPPRVRRQVEPPQDLAEAVEIDTKIMNMGFEPSEAYVQERYGKHWTRSRGVNPGFGGPIAAADDET